VPLTVSTACTAVIYCREAHHSTSLVETFLHVVCAVSYICSGMLASVLAVSTRNVMMLI